ncbi:dimethylaniline monooxygenase (N-oxide forming) [Fusarium oxysporum f. sp. vasinfectum 25433]|uniref:Dimethylaniline monooxygenase (N-oxide forming) n=1 Tax=Fusarium oxysporum f. sp. vasinfectum 25433 TaxID=1089449 RepID=X0KMV8_FUSOX|nr:dimethylaniline monooxygenase (N-oxide forming) [Fusarium oxysporum f. sp. vasinfectum 25433]
MATMTTTVEAQPVAEPSSMRSVPGTLNVPVAKFPPPSRKDLSVDAEEVASSIVEAFNSAVSKNDLSAVSSLFAQDDGFRLKSIAIDRTSEFRSPKAMHIDDLDQVLGVQFFFTLETKIGTGQGLARLTEVGDGQWKFFTFYTSLGELKGHEELINERRPKGVEHGGQVGRKNWAERREMASEYQNGADPTVVVIGAGQAGLTAATRLKMLGIEALLIDQNERVGDNWRQRYHQLVLHDPVWYDKLPYMDFPPSWPIFTPKDKLAQFFESYATILELNVWTSTSITSADWDKNTQSWTVTVTRKKGDSTETRTLHPRHVIQATGHSGKKNVPDIKGMSDFKGSRICHSSEFSVALEEQGRLGKKAAIIGSCNSAHDIAHDFVEKGYHVTIVQRSTTHVVSSKAVSEIALGRLFHEGGPSVEDADLFLHGLPAPVQKAINIQTTKLCAKLDKDMLVGLNKAGFKTDMGSDEAGLLFKYFQRGGGYYIDVGAAKLIADGEIKVKQGQEISEVLPYGIRFEDGSELEADEIVYATGYQNMRTQSQIIFGDKVASKLQNVWGFNEESEMKTMWQDSGHPGFWFHGGNLAICRFYSKLLALQIKGLETGLYRYGDF